MFERLMFWKWVPMARVEALEKALKDSASNALDKEACLKREIAEHLSARSRVSVLGRDVEAGARMLVKLKLRASHYAIELGVMTGKHQAVSEELRDLQQALSWHGMPTTGIGVTSGKSLGRAFTVATLKGVARRQADSLAALLFVGSPVEIPNLIEVHPDVYDADLELGMGAPGHMSVLELERCMVLCKRCHARGATGSSGHCLWCEWVTLWHYAESQYEPEVEDVNVLGIIGQPDPKPGTGGE